jgi:hypothetical protein
MTVPFGKRSKTDRSQKIFSILDITTSLGAAMRYRKPTCFRRTPRRYFSAVPVRNDPEEEEALIQLPQAP